jgi:hypothetical protein
MGHGHRGRSAWQEVRPPGFSPEVISDKLTSAQVMSPVVQAGRRSRCITKRGGRCQPRRQISPIENPECSRKSSTTDRCGTYAKGRGGGTGRCAGLSRSPLPDSNRRPPPYHAIQTATGGSPWHRFGASSSHWGLLATGTFATRCAPSVPWLFHSNRPKTRSFGAGPVTRCAADHVRSRRMRSARHSRTIRGERSRFRVDTSEPPDDQTRRVVHLGCGLGAGVLMLVVAAPPLIGLGLRVPGR